MAETRQLGYWTGEFGDQYIERNRPPDATIRQFAEAFRQIFAKVPDFSRLSFLEVGANIGPKLRALQRLGVGELHAVEPNSKAYAELSSASDLNLASVHNTHGSALPFQDASVDCVFTSGVLIHVHPDDLYKLCSEIVRVAGQYILCMEYFSPNPEAITYRGVEGLLFKRDFGSFYMDNWPDLKLVDYGFFWKRVVPLDNATWWLFSK